MGTNAGNYLRLIILPFIGLTLYAFSSENKPSPRSRSLSRDIDAINEILDQNRLQKEGLTNEMADLEFQVAAAKRVIQIIEGAEKVTDYELNKLENQLDVIEREHKLALSQYQVILVEEYKNRDYRTKLFFLVSSNNFGEFINRLSYLEKLKEFRKKQLRAIETKKSEIGDKLAVYNGTSIDKGRISKLKIEEINKLNELLSEKYGLVQLLEAQTNELELKLNQAQASLNKLNGIKPKDYKTSEKTAPASKIRRMIWPLKSGLVVGEFGVHKHEKERKVQVENNGIDILVAANEQVMCVEDGEIKAILEVPGSNTTVIISHKTHYSVYSNLDPVSLIIGEKVSKKQVLGTVAKNEQGAYKLHFEIWQGTIKLNPQDYLIGRLE